MGYRWRTDVGGSFDTYRSIVNLGSGPKLLGADFTLTDPKHRAFDQIHVRANSWGDEPYQTVHIDAQEIEAYDFSADYRDFAYFNFLPSYADPLLGARHRAQRAVLRHAPPYCEFPLDLLPGNWFIPYFAYDRDSGSGTGATVFFSRRQRISGAQHAARSHESVSRRRPIRNAAVSRHARARRHHIQRRSERLPESRLNQFRQCFNADIRPDDRPDEFAGGLRHSRDQRLQQSAVDCRMPTRGWTSMASFSTASRIRDVHYQQTAAGNLYCRASCCFIRSEQYLISAAAKLPHTAEASERKSGHCAACASSKTG